MLQINDLGFRYSKGGDELFSGLSHTFAPGKVTAVTGASGRGKSTLLYVLGLLLRPSRGAVIVEGRIASTLDDESRSRIRAQQIGFVFQDSGLDPARTILDAVVEPSLYAGNRRLNSIEHAMSLLERLGVDHRATHRPGEISGGQAQRVAVCRALINRPSIVLADEPTGNLDRVNAEGVLSAMRGAAGAATVVIGTHDPFVVDQADFVLAL